MHEEEMADGSDDDTVECANGDNRKVSFPGVSFLKLSVKVAKANKATALMRTRFQEVFKCIRDSDPTAILSHFRLDPVPDADGMFPVVQTATATTPEEIPDSITAMGKFFHGCRPRSEGGIIWTQVRLMHSEPIDNILADTRTELEEKSGNLSLQSIQHWDVETIGFLKNLHPDVDNESMQSFLLDAVNRLHPGEDRLLIGIKVRTPYDGTKRDPNKKVRFKDRIQAYHVDTQGKTQALVQNYLKQVLSSDDFKLRYTAPVRLVPPFDRRSSPNTQEKVKRCILQHSQFCQSIASLPCQGIPSLGLRNRALGRTLRDLVMGLTESHFINIDMNWSNTNHVVLFPRKYESIAKEKAVHLPAFLHKQYGKRILSSFDAATQQIIEETTWDKDGHPMSKLDRELDQVLADDDTLDYVDISFFADVDDKASSTKPSAIFQPQPTAPIPFIPLVDDTSVSTFGTTSPTKKASPPDLHTVAGSTSSDVSMLSRVSKVEEDMSEVKAMLRQLVSVQCGTSPMSTQQSRSSEAAGSKDSSANGV